MNAYNLIAGAAHLASGQFAHYWDFARWIQQRYNGLPYDREIVYSYLNKDIKQMTRPRDEIDQDSALELLIARDLERVVSHIDQLPTSTEFSKNMEEAYKNIIKILRDLGFTFPEPPFFIVDRFPNPYHEMEWVAFAPDKSDEENHGIIPGVYLLKSELAPYYSELTLAHEIIHSIVGETHPNLLGRGLEEGLAELVGTLYIGTRLYSSNIARNVFIHSRFANHLSQVNRLYLDNTRQAFLIYRRFGLRGIFQLLHEGRKKIKEVEKFSLCGDVENLSLDAGEWNKELTDLLDYLLLGFIPNLVVSPLAAYISEFITLNQTIKEVALAAHVEVGKAEEAIKELQDRTYTILLDKERIAFTDLSFLRTTSSFRYEINL